VILTDARWVVDEVWPMGEPV